MLRLDHRNQKLRLIVWVFAMCICASEELGTSPVYHAA
jgi:hypothetical protein